jgi:hypothetical protein
VTDLEHLKAGTDQLAISAALKRDVATFVEQTPVEFGCIDIVHDGHDRHYIIDLNLTPYAGTKENNDVFLTNFLQLGITNPPNASGPFPLAPHSPDRYRIEAHAKRCSG